jgi:hypothetical protein
MRNRTIGVISLIARPAYEVMEPSQDLDTFRWQLDSEATLFLRIEGDEATESIWRLKEPASALSVPVGAPTVASTSWPTP